MVRPCWLTKPDDRPDFETILTAIKIYFDGADSEEYEADDIYTYDIN